MLVEIWNKLLPLFTLQERKNALCVDVFSLQRLETIFPKLEPFCKHTINKSANVLQKFSFVAPSGILAEDYEVCIAFIFC